MDNVIEALGVIGLILVFILRKYFPGRLWVGIVLSLFTPFSQFYIPKGWWPFLAIGALYVLFINTFPPFILLTYPISAIIMFWRFRNLKIRKFSKLYVDAGMALVHELTSKLNLPGWKDLLPIYNEVEKEAIYRKLSTFQQSANEIGGGNIKFHPETVPDLQRMLAAAALCDLAGKMWKSSDEVPPNWRQCVSTYLKAWAGYLNPMALLDMGNLLVKAGCQNEAKKTFLVVLNFPGYAHTYYKGQENPELIERIVSHAKESLQKSDRWKF